MGRIEKRKMERFDLKLSTKLSWAGKNKEQESIELMTSDICAGGAYFKTQNLLLIGTNVELIIKFPLDKFKNIKSKASYFILSGSVIRVDQLGFAICFDRKYKILPF